MKVIDTHLHLDGAKDWSAQAAVDSLAEELHAAGVERGLVLQLNTQRWGRTEVGKAIEEQPGLIAFANVHPFDGDAKAQLSEAVEVEGYRGLKLHPRLQRYRLYHEKTVELVRHAGCLGVPVLADGFPDGDWMLMGQSIDDFGHLARDCPDTDIIAAHMGGHKVLDLMMIAKRVPNLYCDISFSLLYYRGSSVPADLCYALKSMRFKKVFYGSDYPDRSIEVSLRDSLAELEKHGVSGEQLDALLYHNADEFFSWKA